MVSLEDIGGLVKFANQGTELPISCAYRFTSSTSSGSRSVLHNETDLEKYAEELREFLTRMGQEARQGAVGLVIDRDYLEIRFPLAEE